MNNEVERLQRENTRLRTNQEDSVRLLKACSSNCGTMLQEEVAEHLASIKGLKHNSKDWDMADRNGEQ